jgi:hypothetical protein
MHRRFCPLFFDAGIETVFVETIFMASWPNSLFTDDNSILEDAFLLFEVILSDEAKLPQVLSEVSVILNPCILLGIINPELPVSQSLE